MAALVLQADWPWSWVRLSNILHKKDPFKQPGNAFCCPLHAWHLSSTNEAVLLAETHIHAACQSQMWAVWHMPSTLFGIHHVSFKLKLLLGLWDVKLGLSLLDFLWTVSLGLREINFYCIYYMTQWPHTERDKKLWIARLSSLMTTSILSVAFVWTRHLRLILGRIYWESWLKFWERWMKVLSLLG